MKMGERLNKLLENKGYKIETYAILDSEAFDENVKDLTSKVRNEEINSFIIVPGKEVEESDANDKLIYVFYDQTPKEKRSE